MPIDESQVIRSYKSFPSIPPMALPLTLLVGFGIGVKLTEHYYAHHHGTPAAQVAAGPNCARPSDVRTVTVPASAPRR
jgi:hypothetical protein